MTVNSEHKCSKCGEPLGEKPDSPPHSFVVRYTCKKCGKDNVTTKPSGLGPTKISGSKESLKKQNIIKEENQDETE